MANQPTKYSKFLVGAASAALVASAVAPVASAADFKDTKGNTHEEAINALSDAGIIKGYTDGSFQPNKTLTRSDVVKMMGKWLVTEGASIPEDARTNPRFSDLTTKSNGELLDYAAVVKDAGVFIGSNGKLLAGDNITRENMALVLVRAFDTVNEIDLVTYVNGQDFKADVKDLKSAKAEAQGAINVLDFYDITNPAVANFNPKGSTTRGHFATFLHKSINADFSDVTGVVSGAVKAVNATTVEVTFKEAVKDVKTSDYTIEGLAISNAVVKQTDNKVVVLTTAAQTGDKEYTLKSGKDEIGKFKGISAVVPTKITMNTASTQGVVGKEVTLKADIGVKEAGVAVTFNVAAGSKLNKDHIEEVTTNAEGIATYSYTQYVSGEKDDVVAYPTGAPAVRSLATVYWGVDTILTVTPSDDKQGNNVANGANKVYKVTYKNPKTGAAVANQRLHVTFVENVNVTIDKVSKATINGTNPMQLSNGTTPVTAEVITDSKGEATFTVSGHNTTVTPVVFPNEVVVNNNYNNSTSTTDVKTWDATKLQAQVADKLVFGATQADYVIDVTRDGGEEAARLEANGREYKVVLKTKDGKAAANEIVNVAFNEDIDRNINTNTEAYFTKDDKKILDGTKVASQITVKTDSKGEATFTISSDKDKDYATPIAWIDINTSNAKEGKFDDGEPFKIAPISYFAEPTLTGGTVKAYNAADKAVKEFTGIETATFKFTAANQSGKQMGLPTGYSHIEASFTVFNTGSDDITVDGHVVSPNRSHTTSTIGSATATAQISVKSVGDKTASVRVVANGTAIPLSSTNNRAINLGSHTAEVKFASTTAVGSIYTGVVPSYNTADKTVTFAGKLPVKYAGETGYTYKYFGGNGAQLANADAFITELTKGGTAVVTYKVDADKLVTLSIVSIDTTPGATGKPVDTNKPAGPTVTGTLAFDAPTYDVSLAGVTATLTVGDADLNIDPAQIDTATVAVKDSAGKALTLTLNETGVNTGVFTTVLTEGTLKTLSAGTLTATYVDVKNAAGKEQTITATATLKIAAGVLGAGTFTQATAVTPATAAVLTIPSFDPNKQFGSGQTIDIAIDGGAAVIVDLDGKTGAIGVAAAINAAITGATATVSGNSVVITTASANGTTSSIAVTPTNVSEIIAATKTGVDANNAATKATYAFSITTALAAGEKVVIGGETYALTTTTVDDQAAELVAAINASNASAFTATNTGAPSAAVLLEAKAAGDITAPVVTVK